MTDFAANSHSDLKWPEGAPAEKPAGMEEGDAPAEGDAAAMEGGEGDMDAAAGGDAAATGLKAWGEFAAVTDLPKLLTALTFTCNVFGDAVTAQILHKELGGNEYGKQLGVVATLVAGYCLAELAGEGATEGESFAPALLTADCVAEVKESFDCKDKEEAIIFPGAIASYPDLTQAEGEFYKKEGYTKVMYKMTTKTFKPAGPNFLCTYRPFFTVEKWEEPAEGKDYAVVTLTPFKKHLFADIAAWTAAVEGGAAVAGAAVEAAKDAAAKPEEEAPKEGEMAEGEAM